jgi:hypothetical protein
MTDAVCMPSRMIAPSAAQEQRPDRLAELLECVADRLVETGRERIEIARDGGSDDPRLRDAVARVAELECSLGAVGAEAACVHQLLQHVHLI